MNITELLEEFDKHIDVNPSEKMIEIGNKIKKVLDTFEKEVHFDERTCLKIDFEHKEDYPVVSVYNDIIETHVYPKDFDLNGEMELQLTSEGIDNTYTEEEFDKLIEDAKGEMNV